MKGGILLFMINGINNDLLRSDERIDEVDERISLIQKKNGFSYGTDAVLLAAFIRKMSKKKAVEFGAGTGIISLLCEEYSKFDTIYSVEVQDEYFDLLSRNKELNKSNINVIRSDIRNLKEKDFGGEVDVVFSNPPYMKTTSGKSNCDLGKNTARHEVMGGIEDFCYSASHILKHGGLFYCVYRPDRAIDLLYSMRKYDLEPKRVTYVYPYIDARPCLMLVEAKKGASSSVFLTKPFIIFNSATDSNYDNTEDMKMVYRECDMSDEYKKL